MQDILDLREIDLDLREIDSKLGPISKWNRKKLLTTCFCEDHPKRFKFNEDKQKTPLTLAGRIANRQRKMEYLADIQYVEETDFSQPPEPTFVSPALGYPHPSNHDF